MALANPVAKAPAKKAAPPARPVGAKKKIAHTAVKPHTLEALIPAYHFYEDYVPRVFPGGMVDLDILLAAQTYQDNVSMSGDTGTGKTSAVFAFCAQHSIPLVTIACNGAVDPSTLFSRPVVLPDGAFKNMESAVVKGMIEGPCVIYMDEMNFMPARIGAVFHGGLDKRRQLTIPELDVTINVHPDTLFVGTFNPEYEGTRSLNWAFANRWKYKLLYEYDRKQEAKIVTGIPVLLDLADRLRHARQNNGGIETPIGVNLLLEFEDIAWKMNVEFALHNFKAHFQAHERSAVQNALDHFKVKITQQRDAGVAAEAKRLAAEKKGTK